MCARCERRCAREDCKSNEPAHFRPARRRFLAAVFPPPKKAVFSCVKSSCFALSSCKVACMKQPSRLQTREKKKKKWNNISGAPKAFTLSPSLNHERTICISKISFSSIDCPLSDENASSQREPLFLAVTSSSSSSCAFGSSVCLLLGWSRSWSHKNFCIRKKKKISSVSRRDLQSLSSSCGKCSATSTRINHRSDGIILI